MVEYKYLRPKKADHLRKWHEDGFEKIKELKCDSYIDAVILPIKKQNDDGMQFGLGGVVDSQGVYVESSSIEKRVGGAYPYSISRVENSKVVYCGYCVKHWGHFLIEAVARIWYFLENDNSVDKYVFVSEENGSTELFGNYLEFFELLGVADKLQIINKPVKYREVLVPELSYSRKYYYHDKYKEVFDRIAENANKSFKQNKKMPKKVFLSRSQFAKAKQAEIGLDYLDHYFSKNGYTILYPEKLSLTQLIQYLYNADVCASSSGTIPHNLLFSQKGKKAIIVERQTTVNEIQANIDIVCDLDVTYIDGHYSIYPVLAGYGPYIFGYTKCFQKFNEDFENIPPDKFYCTDRYYKTAVRKYLQEYRRTYGYCWGMEEWQLMYADAHYEAYLDSLSVFSQYINGTIPFMRYHYFSPHYLKQIIKKILRKGRYS